MAYLINSIICESYFEKTQLVSSYQLYSTAILLGVLTGILMPLVSNIIPIKRALGKALRDSLNLFHRVSNEVFVSVVKLEQMGMSAVGSLIGFMMVAMGLMAYYFAPMAFIFQNTALFLAILNIILIIMIIGFTLFLNIA